MSTGDRTEPDSESDLVHGRIRESPIKRWLLLDGNRHTITVVFSMIVFVTCFTLGAAGYIPVRKPGTATTLVAAIVGGTLPFITIVLAINQLVLSQELGWPGELQERYDGMTGLRREVESLTDAGVTPAAPADFLQFLMGAIKRETGQLADQTASSGQVGNDVSAFAASIATEADRIQDGLENTSLETFDALSAVLGHFNGAQLHAARRLRHRHEDAFGENAHESLGGVIQLLGYLAIARQTFKTLYMQHELASLSKLLLYVGFPTLLAGGLFMMSYPTIIETVAAPLALVALVSTVVTLVFLPFIVLLVYTFRIATVASRTADFGPFVPRTAFRGEPAGPI